MANDLTTAERIQMQLLVIVLLFVGSMIIGCTHYQYNVLPQKMAEKDYCWVVVSVPTGSGVTTNGAYRPCPREPGVEKP